MKQKVLEATKSILEKNMEIEKSPFCDKKVVLIYDDFSELSTLIGEAYKQNLENIIIPPTQPSPLQEEGVEEKGSVLSPERGELERGVEIIKFSENSDKKQLQDFLMNLEEHSTVILVQSTNFRLDNFRIRLNLKNIGVGCLEHNHLGYMTSDQVEHYVDSIEYKTPYYEALSDFLKERVSVADNMEMKTKDGNILRVKGGFEDLKRNTGNYTDKYRGGTFPIGENFTEGRNFDGVNGSFAVYAYPDLNFQVQFCEPFVVQVEKSMLTCDDQNCPEGFRKLLDKIAAGEDGEVMVRELGFGMNTGISKEKQLSDVNAFERVSGFHISLGKKHQIYRKKLHRKITQRYHIDIFPDVETIAFDGEKVFENGKYLFTQ